MSNFKIMIFYSTRFAEHTGKNYLNNFSKFYQLKKLLYRYKNLFYFHFLALNTGMQ
jgi:hypothetical protein